MVSAIDVLIARIINGILAVIVFFLGLRIAFQLFNANPNTPFVAWVYEVSEFFMAPFRGIFPSQLIGESILDLPALIALIIYALIAQVIIALISGLSRSRHTVVHTDHESTV